MISRIKKISSMNHLNVQGMNQTAKEKRRDVHTFEMNVIDRLPRDIIIEILSRLPVETICKFRCVSKSWNELLTYDRDFISRQTEISKQNPLFLIRRYLLSEGIPGPDASEITIELTSMDMQGDVVDKFRKVIDGPVHTFVSCGPLSVLCCMYSLYVCNPSVHGIVRVPCRSNYRFYSIGFGYVPGSDEFKIVHLFYHSSIGDGKMGCEIFSFRTCNGVSSGSWRTIGDCPFSAWTDQYPICVKGVIYWSLSNEWKFKTIISLDLEKEEFRSISYPIKESKKYSFLEYIGLSGSLCVVGFSSQESTMDIWMLKKKDWVLKCSINLSPLCPKFLVPSDDRSEEVLVHMQGNDLISYSLAYKTSRKIEYYKETKTYNKPCLYYSSPIPLNTSRFLKRFPA